MRAAEAVEAARAALAAWDEAHQLVSVDPGMQSMRFHESQATRSKNLTAHMNKRRREGEQRARLVTALEKAEREARRAELPQTPVDPAELPGAVAVLEIKHGHGEWRRVIRVNKTTVTCWAPPGHDQPRIPHDRIYAIRKPEGEAPHE